MEMHVYCLQEWEEREDEDVIVIERILLLMRNLLHISANPQEEKVWPALGHVTSGCGLHEVT